MRTNYAAETTIMYYKAYLGGLFHRHGLLNNSICGAYTGMGGVWGYVVKNLPQMNSQGGQEILL